MNTIGSRRNFLAQVAFIGLSLPNVLRADGNSSIPTYGISNVVKSSENDYRYYKVDVPSSTPFHIVTKEKCTLNSPFLPSNEYETMGKPFPINADSSKPVALIEGKELGLKGHIEVYDLPTGYRLKYKFSPLIEIPSHTSVSSDYLIDTQKILDELPESLHESLVKAGAKIILAKDPEDAYYHYAPSQKEADKNKKPIQNGKWVGYKDGQWFDNRKFSHAPSRNNDLTIYSPEKYEDPLENLIVDRKKYKNAFKYTLLHELGHVIGNVKNHADKADFNLAFESDKRRLKVLKNNDVAYAYVSKYEAFAEIVCCFLGGYPNERKRDTLCSLYECSEFVRTKVLPDLGLKFSENDVEKIIENHYVAYS